MRKEFDYKVRESFLKLYVDTSEAFKRFSLDEIEILKKGRLPKGWNIHHKLPLFRGGDNEFSNLRLMKKKIHDKYRKRLHYYEKGKNIYKLG